MDTTEIAWAAGFFDGEGTAYASKSRNRYYLVLTVANTNREALERFQRAAGGRIYPRARSSWGRKDLWVLAIGTRDGVSFFIEHVYPILCGEKKAAVDRARVLEAANPKPLTGREQWQARVELYGPSGRKDGGASLEKHT